MPHEEAMTFKQITPSMRHAVLCTFLDAIGKIAPLDCGDLAETNDAIDLIAMNLRNSLTVDRRKGLLMLAKVIIDRANV